MKQLIVAFTGPSNTGKTTLITKLVEHLAPSHKVCVIKHDPKDKAELDREGKDSQKFYAAGAHVGILSPERSTFFFRAPLQIQQMIESFAPFDYLFIEGLKTLPFPRIGVFRNELDESYLPYTQALALQDIAIKSEWKERFDLLELADLPAIIQWIDQNGAHHETS